MENKDYQKEIEKIRQQEREETLRAIENLESVFSDKHSYDGINAVLHFFHEKILVDKNLPLSKQLEEIEERANIKMRYIELEHGWYKSAVIPLLVNTLDGRHLAIIPDISGRCFYIENGKRIRVTKERAKYFSDNALCFYKSAGTEKVGFKEFASFFLKSITLKDALNLILICALATIAGLMLPWANSFIFAHVVPSGNTKAIIPTASLLFSAISVAAIMRLLQSFIISNTMQRADTYIQSGIFSKLLMLKPEFFKKVKAGELSRMVIEFSDLSRIISVESISALIGIVLSFVYLFQIHFYAPQLTGFVILISVILLAIMIAAGRISAKWMREYSRSMSSMAGFCYELFSGIEHIKLGGAEARMIKRWSEHYADTAEHEEKPAMLEFLPVIYKVLTVAGTFFIFLLGSKLEASNYIAFSASYGAYIAAFLGAGTVVQAVSQFRSSYELVKPILTAECEDYGSGKRKIKKSNGDIQILDLNFRYSEDLPLVIKQLSLDIKSGESVGIIGPSGSGKTTLIRLILGFESYDAGSITVDGIDLRELDLKSYRRTVGMVLQNDGLLNGDIYTNITIGKIDATADEVNEAVDKAGLREDIDALPMGLYTRIGAENGTLSGGQVQRILIARALLKDPSIIIFDEATSALDNITQAKITKTLEDAKCTKILVAHRLSTIKNCDKIVVLEGGRIVQQGTFEELKNEEGLFKELIKKQTI